jgi:AraC-like DNA-binding protein
MSSRAFDPCPPFLIRRAPRRELAGVVLDITGYKENGEALSGQIEMASLVVPLVISFGGPFRIALGRGPSEVYRSFTAGLYAGPVVIGSFGTAECVQINFTPLGAHRVFGLPMREFANRMVALDDFGDREIGILRQRLQEEQDWDARLELAEDFVMKRLLRTKQADPAVCWAFDRIVDRKGNLRIEALASRLEWSRKHLSDRFRTALGLSPKAVARMVRFQAALSTAREESDADWAEIAAACGYADQAHLTREFAEFSGTTPQRWRMAA